MAEVTILDTRHFPAAAGPRAGKNNTLIIFQETGGQPLSTVIESEAPTKSEVDAAIMRVVKLRGEHINRKLTV